ncbi:hypothetical protein [Nocardia australiensis]|uniref:hypothetical protein n=1 Tax=Nocardia australiensis TaxID=2887191 RepID=UPI001D156679|nr:hypothetical protein [Nocardia australiensis]
MNSQYRYDDGAQGNPRAGYPQSAQRSLNGNPPPSRVTAIAAGVLAAIAGVLAIAGTIISIAIVADVSNDEHVASDLPDLSGVLIVLFALFAVLAGTAGLMYLLGALLLFARKTAGRVLVIIASVLGVAGSFVGFGQDPNIGRIAVLAFCVVTLVLAAVPSTGRWIAAGKHPPHQQAGSYLPHP